MDVILAVDDDLLFGLQYLADDDVLIRDITRDAVAVQEVDRVEQIRLQILAQLIERRAIQPGAAVSVIDVFFDEDIPGIDDLFFQCQDLAIDRPLFLLQV